ncbi:hypothetical protein LCGC14_0602370 [marine sediment metagenome]|uniref:Capsid protein n=1 Tax=marine sediment metagenome TaxID=412755 RepID=A0A0F9UIQ6_9ZZZZ
MAGNAAAFLGLKSTGDFVTDEMPENWREGVLRLHPNGDAPLTALTALMPSKQVDSPELNWWDKGLPTQRAALTDDAVYTDAALTSTYASGGVAGDTMYCKMAEASTKQFRAGHQVQIKDADDYRVTTTGKVTSVLKNGASSYVAIRLQIAANATYDLDTADTLFIIGSQFAEGAPTPAAVTYEPTKYENKTQIMRNPVDLTRTAMKTHTRTGDVYKEAKLDALELHSIEIEKALFWSELSEVIGDNGKPERTMRGLVPAIELYAADNVKDYTLDTDYSGDTWIESGEDFLDKMFELMFRFGKGEKLAFCGSGAMLGVMKLAKTYGNINLVPTDNAFGIQTVRWLTSFGMVHLKRHPLFSFEPTHRHSMVIIEPTRFEFMYVDDTFYKKDDTMRQGGQIGIDGILEEFLTEACLRYHFMPTAGYLNGVGLDNTL